MSDKDGGDQAALVPVPDAPPPTEVLPEGVQPSRNYLAAVQLGHVLAASHYFTDARDPAKAAVKIMIGMDLGLSPIAAMQTVHAFEEGGKMVFVLEAKALAALVKLRDGYDYRLGERTEEKVEVEFYRHDEKLEPTIVWTIEDAKRAGLTSKDNWKKYPREMLTWRAIAEGVRLHFPELLAGAPIYTDAEFGDSTNYREALEGPAPATPLTDDEAEQLRGAINEAYAALCAINPKRMPRPLLERRIRDAEHSHENLRNVLASVEALRDSEGKVVELAERYRELAGEDKEAVKDLLARGERRASNDERIELYTAAVEGLEAEQKAEQAAADEADEAASSTDGDDG